MHHRSHDALEHQCTMCEGSSPEDIGQRVYPQPVEDWLAVMEVQHHKEVAQA